jgi:hypothetical protein
MAVFSRRQTDRFTPSQYRDNEDPPVFIIAPLTYRERARFNADLVACGVSRYPSNAEIIKAVRKALDEVDPEMAAPAIAIVESYAASEAIFRADGEPIDINVADAYQIIEDQMRLSPHVGRLMAARTMFNMLAPPLAAAHALRGWVNVDLRFRLSAGIVPDDLLEQLDQVDVMEIGVRALELMRPNETDRKNLEAPTGSVVDHETSMSN